MYPHLSTRAANVKSDCASHSRNAAGGVSLRISLRPMNSTATSSSCPITGINEGMSWIGLNTYPMEQLAINLAGHGTFGDRNSSVSRCTCFVTAIIGSHHPPLSNLSVKLVTATGSVIKLRRYLCGVTRDLCRRYKAEGMVCRSCSSASAGFGLHLAKNIGSGRGI